MDKEKAAIVIVDRFTLSNQNSPGGGITEAFSCHVQDL